MARQVLGEDPAYYVFGLGVRGEWVQPLAVRRLGRVGMRADIHEHVAVRRAPAEEPALDLRLRGHGRADADLDAAPLSLAHAAEHRHH